MTYESIYSGHVRRYGATSVIAVGSGGHVVDRITRSPVKAKLLKGLGVEPIVCDVFDREALIQGVRDVKPDVVLNELTDLPNGVSRLMRMPN